jgi:hypothetical protein
MLLEASNIRMFSPNIICNCVNSFNNRSLQGELYHSYSREPYRYDGIVEMLNIMEELYDTLQFPMASTESRSFFNSRGKMTKKGMAKVMKDEILLDKRGEKGTFIIQVQYRQNATWQGKVVWVEENKTQHFRSALELIKLVDEALREGATLRTGNSEKELLIG